MVVYYLSQLAVLDVIINKLGKKEFLKQLKDRLHSLNKEDDEEISEIDENLAGSESCAKRTNMTCFKYINYWE